MKLGVSQSPVQSDPTNVIFLSGAVFVCCVVSGGVCVVRGVLSRVPCQLVRLRCPSDFFKLDASSTSSRAWLLSALAFSSSPAGRRRLAVTAVAGRRDVARGGRIQGGGTSDPVH